MDLDAHYARLLADLPEALVDDSAFIDELRNRSEVITIRKGDYLLRAGELCQDAYFINRGLFIILYISSKGEDFVTGFAVDNQYPFLSSIGYFTQEPSEFEIKAIEEGELLRFPRAFIEEMSLRYPLFASYYQHAMLKIMSKSNYLFAIRQSSSAEEFIKYLYDKQMPIANRVPDKYIARYMGITTEWYCKLKKRVFS